MKETDKYLKNRGDEILGQETRVRFLHDYGLKLAQGVLPDQALLETELNFYNDPSIEKNRKTIYSFDDLKSLANYKEEASNYAEVNGFPFDIVIAGPEGDQMYLFCEEVK